MITPTGVFASEYNYAIYMGNPTHVRLRQVSPSKYVDESDLSINGITIEDVFNGDVDLVFGNAVSKQVEIIFLKNKRHVYWDNEFTLEFGVEMGDPATTNWVKIGHFTGEKPNNVTTVEEIKFVAYDRMKKFDVLADDFFRSIEYPITIQEIYDGLCEYVGVSNTAGDELPEIMNRSYDSAPVDMIGYTCRDILAWIAEACGCYAKITPDGECKLAWFTKNSSRLVNDNHIYNLEMNDFSPGMAWEDVENYTWSQLDEYSYNWRTLCGDESARIDHLCVKQLDSDFDIDYPVADGNNTYTIIGNPFLSVSTAEDVSNYIVPIYNRLHQFILYPQVTMSCIGSWLVEAGDMIRFMVENTWTYFPIFTQTFHWNGATNATYETTMSNIRNVYNNNSNKERVLNSKMIRMVVKDSYYEIQSGIEITSSGVSIHGDKYVSIETSGGNKWVYDYIGMHLNEEGSSFFDMRFWLGEDTPGLYRTSMTSINFHDQVYTSATGAETFHELTFAQTNEYEQDGELVQWFNYLTWGGGKSGSDSIAPAFAPRDDNFVYLGDVNRMFNRIYASNICGRHNASISGRIRMYPNDSDTQTRLDILYDNDLVIRKTGTSAKKLVIEGTLDGSVKCNYSSATNMNDITTPGVYMVNVSNMSNRPSTLTVGGFILEVYYYSNDYIVQVINASYELYIRDKRNGSWSGWYKYTGTQV